MDSLSCSQRRWHCGKRVAEARSDPAAGCRESGIEGQRSRSENCTNSVLHVGNASVRHDRARTDCLKPLSTKVCNWMSKHLYYVGVFFLNVAINKMYFSVKDTLQVSLQFPAWLYFCKDTFAVVQNKR